MTDDQFWRIVIGSGLLGAYAGFRPQIDRFLYRLGYRKGPSQTGWRRAMKIVGIPIAVIVLLMFIGTWLK